MKIHPILSKIKQEEKRNSELLHLTANEAQMSETARMFLDSKISERYYVGGGKDNFVDLGPLTMVGMPGVAELVTKAEEAAKEMLGAKYVNLNCLSGVHAMMCAILSTTEPGETVMTVNHDHGGHFATKGIVERVGRKHVFAAYDFKALAFDVKELKKIFVESGAVAFYMDVSYYLNPHNLKEIREALGEKAIIIYDASHTMGLIMGGEFQAPLKEGANVVCANTHKTLPGPQKGMVAFRDEGLGKKANGIINACLYSSPHTHHMIALATTILEMREFGGDYAKQVIANSNALGEALAGLGYELREANTGRWSENHQVHVFTEKVGDYRELWRRLFENNMAVNFDDLFDKGIFIRLGTQEITRRGMKEGEMVKIAEFLDRAMKGEDVKSEVRELNEGFGGVKFGFD